MLTRDCQIRQNKWLGRRLVYMYYRWMSRQSCWRISIHIGRNYRCLLANQMGNHTVHSLHKLVPIDRHCRMLHNFSSLQAYQQHTHKNCQRIFDLRHTGCHMFRSLSYSMSERKGQIHHCMHTCLQCIFDWRHISFHRLRSWKYCWSTKKGRIHRCRHKSRQCISD